MNWISKASIFLKAAQAKNCQKNNADFYGMACCFRHCFTGRPFAASIVINSVHQKLTALLFLYGLHSLAYMAISTFLKWVSDYTILKHACIL